MMKKKFTAVILTGSLFFLFVIGSVGAADKPILKIGYSDWPGWVAWEIGIQKGWFKEAGVDARFFGTIMSPP